MMAIGRDGLDGQRKTRAGRAVRGALALILLAGALALPALPVHAGATDDLFVAAAAGPASEVKAALAAGADVNARDTIGATPLHWAVGFNTNPAVTRALLKAGADADIEVRTLSGSTPLHHAAMAGNAAALEVLIEAGANVHARGAGGARRFTWRRCRAPTHP